MDENQGNKVLIASSIPLEEVEDDQDEIDKVIDSSEVKSDFIYILDSIGKSDFKQIYLATKNNVLKQSLKDQIELCRKILIKIKEVYNFEFIETIDIISIEDVKEVLEFLEFLEFDNFKILSDILYGLETDFRKIPLISFFNDNWVKIEEKINKNLFKNRLINLFFRTNNKQDLIDFLVKHTNNNRIELTIEFFRKGENLENGRH